MFVKSMLLPIILASVVILAGGASPSRAARAPTGSLGPTLASATSPVGPEVQISTPSPPTDADRHSPAIAYNYQHHEYLVVWHNEWPANKDIYAQRVSDSGQLVGPWFAVSYGAGNRLNAAVAYNATNDEYLVVWQYEPTTNNFEIWGRRIKWNGADLNEPEYAEFKIFSLANRGLVVPRVAYNGYRNEYLVAWNAFDTATLLYTAVACKRVLADGSMPDPTVVVSNVGEPAQVDIVYNVALDGYMVVWRRDGGATDYDIYAAFLDRYGAKTTPPGEFAVNSYLSDQRAPAVTTNEQNHYMVVWQHFDDSYSPGDWDICGELLQADGSVVDGPFVIANTLADETAPDVAANGANQEYLTVWGRDPGGMVLVTGRLRNSDGTLEPAADISRVDAWYLSPVVACDIPGFFIAYQKLSWDFSTFHIYGRKWLPEEVYVPLALRKHTQ